jgi:hypothetical protein
VNFVHLRLRHGEVIAEERLDDAEAFESAVAAAAVGGTRSAHGH